MPHLIAHETLGVRVIRPRSFARVRRVVARAAIVTRRLSPASTRPAPSHLSTVLDRVSRASTPETDQFTLPHPPVRARRLPRDASTASTDASSTASSAAASTARHDARARDSRDARRDSVRESTRVRSAEFRSVRCRARRRPAAARASRARGRRRARSSAVASLFRARRSIRFIRFIRRHVHARRGVRDVRAHARASRVVLVRVVRVRAVPGRRRARGA